MIQKDLEIFLQNKINDFVQVLKKEMTKENVNEITYGDKLTALGGLNMAIATMQQLNPEYKFDIKNYYTEKEIADIVANQQCVNHGFGHTWTFNYKNI